MFYVNIKIKAPEKANILDELQKIIDEVEVGASKSVYINSNLKIESELIITEEKRRND